MKCPHCGKALDIKDIIFSSEGSEIVVGTFYKCESCGYFENELLDDTESGVIN